MSAIDNVEVGSAFLFAGYGPFTPLLPIPVATADLLLDAIAARRVELQEERDARYRDDARHTALGTLADQIEALG